MRVRPLLRALRVFVVRSCLLVSLLFLTGQHNVFAAQEATKDWLAEGKKNIAEGHFSEAVAAFSHFKEIAPQDPRPYFLSGLALAEAGHLSSAAAELSEAVRLDPDQPDYLLSQANVLTRLGQKNLAVKALSKFENYKQQDQLSVAGLWQLVEIYYRLEKAEDGLRTLGLLSQRTPEDPLIEIHRGRMYKLIGNLDLAEGSFRKSLEISPANPVAHYELAMLLEQRGDLSASKKNLLEALKADEANPEYLYALGTVCLGLKEFDEAIRYLEKAATSDRSVVPQIYYALGQAYQRKGDPAQSAKYFKLTKVHEVNLAQRQKEIREHEELMLITLGEERLQLGNTAEARALFEQVLQSNPENWSAHEYLAKMALNSGEWRLAQPHLLKMQEIDPDSGEGNFLMAFYYFNENQLEEARRSGERAKSVQPNDAELRNLLGNIYLKLEQTEKAKEEYSAAVRLAPERNDFQTNLRSLSAKQSDH